MCTAYKPCIIVSLFGCVMNYCNLAKCVTIYELYSLSNDMNETCLSCIEQNQIVLIVCQIPKIVQTAFVWSRDFLLQTKHGRQWPGGPPLWLEQVLVEMNLIPDLQSTSKHQIHRLPPSILSKEYASILCWHNMPASYKGGFPLVTCQHIMLA